jgi:hypothetical protein
MRHPGRYECGKRVSRKEAAVKADKWQDVCVPELAPDERLATQSLKTAISTAQTHGQNHTL